MSQAKIYWDTDNYNQVEKIFRKSVEFCSEHDVWKLNVAHVLFMQVGTYLTTPRVRYVGTTMIQAGVKCMWLEGIQL